MKCKQSFNVKELEDIKKLMTTEGMKSLNHSKAVPKAVSLIDQYSDQYSSSPREPKMCNDMHARDCLATTTAVDNGKRTGPAANMILGEFEKW